MLVSDFIYKKQYDALKVLILPQRFVPLPSGKDFDL